MTALLSKLSQRERWLVLGGAVFVGAALIFGLVINPILDKKNRYIRMAQVKRQELALFDEYASEYRSLQSSFAQLEKRMAARGLDMSLLAAMENNARKLALADKIASMKPFSNELESGMVRSSVEMRIEKIDLAGLVRFIKAIEDGPHMAVTSRLRIKSRFDDPALLDATLLVTMLENR